MDREQYIDDITTAISALKNTPVDVISYSEALRKDFMDLRKSMNNLPHYVFEELNWNQLRALHSYLYKIAFSDLIEKINSDEVSAEETQIAADEFRTACTSAANICRNLYNSQLMSVNDFSEMEKSAITREDKIEELEKKLENIASIYSEQLSNLKNRMEHATAEAEELPEKIAEVNAFKPIIEPYAEDLEKNVGADYKRNSEKSLNYFILCFALLLIFLFGGYEVICNWVRQLSIVTLVDIGIDPNNSELVTWYKQFILFSVLISKVSIFLLLTYLLYFFGRNFSVFKHNSTVLEHRISCMRIYEKFVSHPNITNETKATITSHAGDAIFSHKDTGFLRGSNKLTFTVPNLLNASHLGDPPK